MSQPIDPRIALANERTLLSWVRCALALVAARTAVRTGVGIPQSHEPARCPTPSPGSRSSRAPAR